MSSLKVTCTEEMYQAFKSEAFSPSADSETMADAFKNAIELACMIALRDIQQQATCEQAELIAFELAFPDYKAYVIDEKASRLGGGRVTQRSNMFKAWLKRAGVE